MAQRQRLQSNKALDSRWMRNLETSEKEKFEQALRHDTLVLGRLLEILTEEYNVLNTQEENDSQFDNPNWQFRTAYRNGQKSQLNKVMTLLNFLKE